MNDPTCSPEVVGIIAFARSTGVPYRVTSTYRPGAMTAAGNPSRHGRRLACDFAGPHPGRDTPELRAIFDAFVPIEVHLNELIYSPAPYNIKTGRRVKNYAVAIHWDHVHLAVDPGVNLAALAPAAAPHSDERIEDTDGREEMSEPVEALCAPNGGAWVLTRDGGIRAYKGAPYLGSYPGLPPEARQGERTFVDLTPNDRGGYDLHGSDGSLYGFPI